MLTRPAEASSSTASSARMTAPRGVASRPSSIVSQPPSAASKVQPPSGVSEVTVARTLWRAARPPVTSARAAMPACSSSCGGWGAPQGTRSRACTASSYAPACRCVSSGSGPTVDIVERVPSSGSSGSWKALATLSRPRRTASRASAADASACSASLRAFRSSAEGGCSCARPDRAAASRSSTGSSPSQAPRWTHTSRPVQLGRRDGRDRSAAAAQSRKASQAARTRSPSALTSVPARPIDCWAGMLPYVPPVLIVHHREGTPPWP